VRFWIGPYRIILLANPQGIEHVLLDNHTNYTKGRMYDAFKPIIGNGLLTSEGDFWRRQRRLANPSFRHDKIHQFVPMFAEQAHALLEEWERYADRQEPVDISKEMMRLTFGVVGRALFSTDLERDAGEVGKAITIALAEASRRADEMIPLPLWLPTQSNRRYRSALQTLNDYVFHLIQERRQTKNRPFDLLTMLIEAVDDETSESMSDAQLRDEVMTFLLAGHETTAIALTWTWYLLAEHPEANEKVRAECQEAVGSKNPQYQDLERLIYTRMVFHEAMRLYPPFPFIARKALKADRICGYEVPPGTTILISQFLTHRNPKVWEHPERFEPERFTPKAMHARPPACYLPFGEGQRMCIGEGFATLEALAFFGLAMQRYRLERASSEPVELKEQVTLRPKGGMPMRIKKV
jgi:cytochrome P450